MTFRANIRPAANIGTALQTIEKDGERKIAAAALAATKKAGRIALNSIRGDMRNSGLGRLPNALGMTSDADKQGVHRTAQGFRASGVVFVKGRSERTRGAIESYTVGANIMPKTSRWLWVRTPEIQRIAGAGKARKRVTPGNWKALGMDQKVGPLIQITGPNGRPLLAVQNVGVGGRPGRSGTARSLTKSGRARKHQRRRELVIAFVAIPRTSRAARVNVIQHMTAAQSQLESLFAAEIGKAK